MNGMGFRAEKDGVHWAAVTGTFHAPILLAHDCITPLDATPDPVWLGQLRDILLDLVDLYDPHQMGLHLLSSEADLPSTSKAFENSIRRARVEGVLMEIAQFSNEEYLSAFFHEEERTNPSRKTFRTPDGARVNWKELNSWSRRQAIMAAAALLEQ